jgi:hypothetical protein
VRVGWQVTGGSADRLDLVKSVEHCRDIVRSILDEIPTLPLDEPDRHTVATHLNWRFWIFKSARR